MLPKVKVHNSAFDLEVFLLLNFLSYLGLFVWSRMHSVSFRVFQLCGLLVIPLVIYFLAHQWPFVICWLIYTSTAMYVTKLAFRRPVLEQTPKIVYLYFTVIHQICSFLSALGFFLPMLTMRGSKFSVWMFLVSTYFGVVNRDLLSIAAERMRPAKAIGEKLSRAKYVPANSCAICSMRLRDIEGGDKSVANGNGLEGLFSGKRFSWGMFSTPDEQTLTLPCRHSFHGHCLRGWIIVGKRNICPACGEKVDLVSFSQKRPWLITSFLYSFALGIVRWLLVWNPIVMISSGYGLLLIEKITGEI